MVVRGPVLPRASEINLAADRSGLPLTLRRVSGHSASPGTSGPAAGERPVLPQCLENLAEDSVCTYCLRMATHLGVSCCLGPGHLR